MSDLIITEYDKLGKGRNGVLVQAGQEPAITNQTVSFTTATLSSQFNADTKFIRIISDANAHIVFGDNGISAAATNTRIIADMPEFFAVTGGDYLSIYDGTS